MDDIERDIASSSPGFSQVFRPDRCKPLKLAIILMIFPQLNGVNLMLLYAPTLLDDAGISFGSHLVLSSVPTYLLVLIATIISFPVIHWYRRRALPMVSVVGMGLSHLLMAVLLALHAPAISVLAPMMCSDFTSMLGLALLSWIIVSEIFPNRVRSHELAIVWVFLFGSSFLTALEFPMAIDWLRQKTESSAGMYVAFATICFPCAYGSCIAGS